MPIGTNGFSCTAVGGNVYAIGGLINSRTMASTNAVQIYNSKENSWNVGTPMSIAKGGFANVVVGSKIYLIGGATYTPYTTYSTVMIYDTENSTWSNGTPLPSSRVSSRAVFIEGSIYLVGGHTDYPTVQYMDTVLSLQIKQPEVLSILLSIDEQVQLSISQNLTNNTGVLWTSSNTSVATVATDGKVNSH